MRLSFAHWITWLTCAPGTRAHCPPVDSTIRTVFAPVADIAAKSCWVGWDWNHVYG
jgi:hypothetical protein